MSANPNGSNSNEPAKVLVLSQLRTAEMEPVSLAIDREFAEADIRHTCDLLTVERLASERLWFPDLIIVCQHWPEEFTDRQVERLFGLLPLARWLCVFGAWCEADGRNVSPWPTAVRVPARCAELRIRHERSVLAGTKPALPLTASRDEVFAFGETPSQEVGRQTGPVRVVSPDIELGSTVSDLLKAGGFEVQARRRTDEEIVAVIWDADPWCADRAEELQAFHVERCSLAVIALMTFAHPEDVESVKAAGADAVVAKSVLAADLLVALQNALLCKQGSAK